MGPEAGARSPPKERPGGWKRCRRWILEECAASLSEARNGGYGLELFRRRKLNVEAEEECGNGMG